MIRMNRSGIYKVISLLLGFWLTGQAVMAQCSTCKSAAATRDADGEFLFGGINTGILYLLVLPVCLPLLFGVIWYFFSRQKKEA